MLLAVCAALVACGSDDPGVEIEAPLEEIDAPDLLGYWIVVERSGQVPDTDVRYQFTPQGEVFVYGDSAGAEPARAQYSFAASDQLLVEDADGARFYTFTLADDRLTLRIPGREYDEITLRRLAGVNLEDVAPAPPPSTNIPEDSLPADSLDDVP